MGAVTYFIYILYISVNKVLFEAVLVTDCGDTYGADLGTSSKESY